MKRFSVNRVTLDGVSRASPRLIVALYLKGLDEEALRLFLASQPLSQRLHLSVSFQITQEKEVYGLIC
jgi:hypothetical protein